MLEALSHSQFQYVLFHLNQVLKIPEAIRLAFCYQQTVVEGQTNAVIFLDSRKVLNEKRVIWIEDIPVLFPLSDKQQVYQIDDQGNLIFNHDLIKSAFYLLSGYQEYDKPQFKDNLGRFAFNDSVQCKLKCVHKPIVNYYFQWIASGLQAYSTLHGFQMETKTMFRNFGFLLSHDVDSVDLYTFEYWIYKLKEIAGLRPTPLSRRKNVQLGLDGFLKWTGLRKKNNPHWNFEFMRSLERQHNFKSTFYFLNQGIMHQDAYYSFEEDRIQQLFDFIKNEDCEIGLHGASQSCDSLEVMQANLNELIRCSNVSIVGNRQHRLLWRHPETARIIQQTGLQYDTSLGFAAHEGFRNSYCLPFRLFDFEKDRMLDVWEFPLVVMDVSLFAYQKYTPDQALEKCMNLLAEVKKFNGMFTLLWHNSFFDEVTYPGVTNFYRDLLLTIAQQGPDNQLGCVLSETMMRND